MEKIKKNFILYGFSISLIIVSTFPGFFKTLFVEESGTFKSVGLLWAIVILFAVHKKWKHTKLLFNIVFISTLLFETFIITFTQEPYLFNFILLMLTQIGLVIVFNYSHTIQSRFIKYNNKSEAIVKKP